MPQAQTSFAEAVDDALSGDERFQDRHERILAGRIFIILALVLVLAVVLIALFGLPALNFIGLLGTVVVFVLLIAYATGF